MQAQVRFSHYRWFRLPFHTSERGWDNGSGPDVLRDDLKRTIAREFLGVSTVGFSGRRFQLSRMFRV